MRFYRVNEDWITHLDGDFRGDILSTLRGLNLARLQKYPPPKINGLPLGNETRVAARFLKGRSSQLDASALSGVYRSFLPAEEKLLYKAFRENAALRRQDWESIIGAKNVDHWIGNQCFRIDTHGRLECQFSVVGLDGLIFCVDPMKDHGRTWEPDFLVEEKPAEDDNIQPFYHTYIGLDSLAMIEKMESSRLPRSGRYLDCGPGSGGLLLYFGRRFDDAIGIDINPRAAKLAQFNADLNELGQCKTFCEDAIELGSRFGRFDLVSWNLPFIFLPDDEGDKYVDACGGEMGIGLCLKFIEAVPSLLTETGEACVAAMAPILDGGENVLEIRLNSVIERLGLDCAVKVAQVSLAPNRELWHFHRSHKIRKFESVYLYLKAGAGKLTRIDASATRRAVDSIREKMYARKFA